MSSVIQQLLLSYGSVGRAGGFDRFVKAGIHFDGADAAVACPEWTGKAITFVGNAQLDTAQSKFGGASLLLDGTGDYISMVDSSDWFLGQNNFTIDFWVRFNSVAAARHFVNQGPDGNNRWAVYWDATNLVFDVYTAGAPVIIVSKAWTPSANTWYHIAVVRVGTAFRLFVDGTQLSTDVTDSDSVPDYAGILRIGSNADVSAYHNGWIDEFRVSKGVARWTTTFTPPIVAYNSPVLDDDYSISLLHFNEWDGAAYTVDENGRVWTFNGNARIDTSQSKFGGASLLLDGAGDYLDAPDSPDWVFSGDFTLDAWVKKAADGIQMTIIAQMPASGVATAGAWSFYVDTDNKLKGQATIAGVTIGIASTGTITGTGWHHVAFVRSGTSGLLFIDGVQDGTATITGALADVALKATIGRYGEFAGSYWNGHIDEARFSKGIARWTGNFTPPTLPYGTIYSATGLQTLVEQNTVSLLHFDDAADAAIQTLDYRSQRIWTFVANAQLDTTQFKFGTASLLLDGTGDYLSCPDSDDFFMSTGNCTIDMWIRVNSLAALSTIFSHRTDATNHVVLNISTLGVLTFTITATTPVVTMASASSTITTGQWYHVAVVRNGNDWNLYVDGVSVASVTDADAWPNQTGVFQLGADNALSAFNGWIDEFRISKGIARWTAGFAPSVVIYYD